MKKWITRTGLCALVLVLSAGMAAGQEASRLDEPVQPHPEGDEAIGRLRSPYCPGMMLEVCPSPQAKFLRDSIQALAWNGASADSLVGWMLTNHGEEYRAVPQASGSGLWAWLMPPLALLGGLMLVGLALQRYRARSSPVPVPVQELSQEDESVLEEALKELKDSEEIPF